MTAHGTKFFFPPGAPLAGSLFSLTYFSLEYFHFFFKTSIRFITRYIQYSYQNYNEVLEYRL